HLYRGGPNDTLRSIPTRRSSELAHCATAMEAMMAITIAIGTRMAPSPQIGFGKARPRLFRKMLNGSARDSRTCGSAPRTPLYQRSEEHTSELQSRENLTCRPLLD